MKNNKIKCFGRFDDRDKVCWLCKETNRWTYELCVAEHNSQIDRCKKERWLKENCPHSDERIGKGDEGSPIYHTCKKKTAYNDNYCEPTDECIKKYYKDEKLNALLNNALYSIKDNNE